ncbi:MAG: restriction endonuclease subunit S [Acidobacteriota bacterium]
MTWRKIRLGEVCTIEKGNIGIMKAIPGEFPLVVLGEERRTHNEYQFDDEAVIIPLVSSTGHGHRSMKRIFYQTGKFSVGSILCAVIPKDKTKLSAEFLYRYLDFNKEKELVGRMRGMANVTLPMKEIADVEIPLPPIEHQKKLIEEFQKLETANNQITTELSHQLDLVRQLRQAFLREAMQGKLVPQDTADEPAEILLEKIKAEKEKLIAEKKIKLGKIQEPEKEQVLFDIPSNWLWCILDDICVSITDGTHQTPTYTQTGRVFLSAQNVKPFRFMPENHKFVSEEAYNDYIRGRKAEKGDLLVARVGAGIGETAVIDKDIDFAFYVSLGLVKPFQDFLHSDYLAMILNSPFGVNYAKGNISSKGGSAGNFNLGRIRSFPVSLPPLAEQKRIVEKLEKLMKYCDELEANIRESKANAESLLQVALKEALEPK